VVLVIFPLKLINEAVPGASTSELTISNDHKADIILQNTLTIFHYDTLKYRRSFKAADTNSEFGGDLTKTNLSSLSHPEGISRLYPLITFLPFQNISPPIFNTHSMSLRH